MVKGFHTLASNMLVQSRNLNVISNNMGNTATPGFKKDVLISSTFREEMMVRNGNKNKANPQELGTTTSMIRAAQETVTDFSDGAYLESDRALDFAVKGSGFFEIQAQGEGENQVLYTRNGSFTIDDEGYLALENVGRVMGANGPIQPPTDKLAVRENGEIYTEDGAYVDTLTLVSFTDTTQLLKAGEGMFLNNNPDNVEAGAINTVMGNMLERSNVSLTEELTAMMSSQRALQSASQVLKMYDQLLSKVVTEVGKVQ